MNKSKMHLEKSVPLYLMYTIITASISGMATGVWYISDLYSRMKVAEDTIKIVQKNCIDSTSTLTRLDTQITDEKDHLNRIEQSLNEIVKRLFR